MGYCLPLCEFVIPRLVKPVLEDNEFVILYDLGGEEKKYIKKISSVVVNYNWNQR